MNEGSGDQIEVAIGMGKAMVRVGNIDELEDGKVF
jgi:hypothetical protein